MTDARIGGVARESLVTGSGTTRLGGLAREALISGTGLGGRVTGQAKAAIIGSIIAGADTIIVDGVIRMQGSTRLARANLTIPVATRAAMRSSARLAQIPLRFNVAGRMTTRSAGRIVELNVLAMTTRVSGRATGRVSATVARPGPDRQNQVTINAR